MNFISSLNLPEVAGLRNIYNNFLEGRSPNRNVTLAAAAVAGATISLTWIIQRFRKVDNLSKKCVLITGCDHGFGHILAKKLDALGMHVIACCLTEQGMRDINNVTSERTTPLLLDVTSRDSVESVKKQVEQILQDDVVLWAVVNNAGILGPLVSAWANPDDYIQVMGVNFQGVVEVTHAFLPFLKRSGGRIVNVASIAGRYSFLGGPYIASKFAVEGYSDGLRRYLHDFGISVSIIEPGFFRTNIIDIEKTKQGAELSWDKLPDEEKEEYGLEYRNKVIKGSLNHLKVLPMAMFNKPEMVADAMVHAITSKHPRVRYLVGLDTYTLYLPLSYLPYRWTDFLQRPKVTPAIMKR